MKKKLRFTKSVFYVIDDLSGVEYRVEFTGKSHYLTANIYRLGRFLSSYNCPFGHACKTKALWLVEKVI